MTPYSNLLRIRERSPELLEIARKRLVERQTKGEAAFPFLYDNPARKVVVVDEAAWGDPRRWFFIGDMHGDFFALHTLLHWIKAQCEDFRLVFLGDLFDRGEQPFECLFLLLEWAMHHPERVVWLAGNHDVAFSYDDATRSFRSAVDPSETVEALNGPSDANTPRDPTADALVGFRRAIGRALMDIAAALPRALVFPDGLIATHGGMPHSDLHAKGMDAVDREALIAWLNEPACLQDFTWTRLSRYQKKIPNRSSKGCEFGFKDFESFCEVVSKHLPAKRMIRGHDHPEAGWEPHPQYKINPALTLSGFGFHYMYEGDAKFANYKSKLVAARYRRDDLPEIVDVPYRLEELERVYPQQRTAPASAPEVMAAPETTPAPTVEAPATAAG